MRITPAVLIVILLALAAARADVLHLKGGGKVEGEILEEGPSAVKVKTRFGTMDIPRDRIERIERSKTILQEFAERRAALAADDAEGRFELAEWAKEKGLRKEAQKLLEEAASIDPMHAGANEALGRVLHDGRYVTPEEKERLLRDREDGEMAARGLVRYKDRWVTPEERDALERGLVKHDGRWMSPEEAKRAQGLVPYKGEWIRKEDLAKREDLDRFQAIVKGELSVLETEHFRFFSVYPEPETQKVADVCERVYRDFLGVFALAPDERIFHKAKCRVFLFQKNLTFDRFLDWFGKEMGFEAARIALIRQNRGTYNIYPEPYIAGFQFPDPFEALMGRTVHKVGHIMIHGWRFDGRWLPWWITEGFGAFWEINVLGRCDTFFVTIRGYGDGREGLAEKWQNSEDWKAKLKAAVNAMRDPLLTALKQKGLNDLDHVDLAKSWSVVSWMVERHRERLIEFIRYMKEGVSQDEALQKAFGKDWGELDKDWREYVRSNY